MAAGLLLVLLLVLGGWFYLARPDRTDDTQEVITYSTDRPDETKPDENYEWQGRPDDPKFIRIESVGIEGYIQNVGVDQNREVAVPNNIHVAGWFVDSVRPGQGGLSIIDGHVDGLTQPGIFNNLPNVQDGAEVSVEFGNGEHKTFRVTEVITVSADKAAAVLFSQNPTTASQLNLITCIGDFDNESRRYADRVIVYTERID